MCWQARCGSINILGPRPPQASRAKRPVGQEPAPSMGEPALACSRNSCCFWTLLSKPRFFRILVQFWHLFWSFFMFLASHFSKIFVVCYFFDFPLILGPSILEMLGVTTVKPTSAECHSFSNRLKKLWFPAPFWHRFDITVHVFLWLSFESFLDGIL